MVFLWFSYGFPIETTAGETADAALLDPVDLGDFDDGRI